MIRTVMRCTSLVRLRPGLVAGRAAVSWPDFSVTVLPPPHFSRYMSVATTEEITLEIPDTEKTPEPSKKTAKKKSTKKRRARPTRQKAINLFDKIAPHMPLKTLSAILRKLKRCAPKISSNDEITTRVGQVHALLETAKMPKWTQQRFTEFLLNKPFENLEDTDDFAVNVNKASLDSHVDVLMKARDLSAHRPLLWSVTQRRKISQRKRAAESESASDSSEQDNQVDTLTVHESKSEDTRREEAIELATLLAERLPGKAYQDLMQVFEAYVVQTKKPNEAKAANALDQSFQVCFDTYSLCC